MSTALPVSGAVFNVRRRAHFSRLLKKAQNDRGKANLCRTLNEELTTYKRGADETGVPKPFFSNVLVW